MDIRIAAYGVILREGSILLAHWNEHGTSGWTLPGGGLEEFETAPAAAVREIREETGYEARLDSLFDVDSLFVPAEQRRRGTGEPLHALRVIYRAAIIGGALRNEVGGSTDEARWVPLEEVSSLPTVGLVDHTMRLLEHPGPAAELPV